MSEAKNAVDQPRIEAAVRALLAQHGEGPAREERGRICVDAPPILDGEASAGSKAQDGGANASGTERGR